MINVRIFEEETKEGLERSVEKFLNTKQLPVAIQYIDYQVYKKHYGEMAYSVILLIEELESEELVQFSSKGNLAN